MDYWKKVAPGPAKTVACCTAMGRGWKSRPSRADACIFARLFLPAVGANGHVDYEEPAKSERGFLAQAHRISRSFKAALTPFCDQTVGQTNYRETDHTFALICTFSLHCGCGLRK